MTCIGTKSPYTRLRFPNIVPKTLLRWDVKNHACTVKRLWNKEKDTARCFLSFLAHDASSRCRSVTFSFPHTHWPHSGYTMTHRTWKLYVICIRHDLAKKRNGSWIKAREYTEATKKRGSERAEAKVKGKRRNGEEGRRPLFRSSTTWFQCERGMYKSLKSGWETASTK